MSKAKDIKAYPTELHDLVIRFTHGENEVKINNHKRAILNNLRFEFYAFRKALRQSGAHEMFLNLDAITARIEQQKDGSHTLTFSLLDRHPMFAALREALNASEAISAQSVAPMAQDNVLSDQVKEIVHTPYKSHSEALFEKMGYGSGTTKNIVATPASEASSPNSANSDTEKK